MAMLRIGGIAWLHGCLRLTSDAAMPACSRDSGEDGGCPSQMACDDEFWLRLGSVHPMSLALSSWASACPEDSRASCRWASQDPAFLFSCAAQVLSAPGHSSQRSAMLLRGWFLLFGLRRAPYIYIYIYIYIHLFICIYIYIYLFMYTHV